MGAVEPVLTHAQKMLPKYIQCKLVGEVRNQHPKPGNVKRFRGGLVFKAHRLCVSLNSRLESNKEEKKPEAIHHLTVLCEP